MKRKLLKSYAELVVKKGLALRKNQPVVIRANVDIEDFTALVVKECYKAGASYVYVDWSSEVCRKISFISGKEKFLSQITPMDEAFEKWATDELPAFLWLDSDDPDGLVGIDFDQLARIRSARYKVIGHYKEERASKYQWCICGVPSKKWAKKVFPELSPAAAYEKLWEAILYTSRADKGDGIHQWDLHDDNLKKKCDYLNSLNLRKLHYTSSNGTDLTVGLIPGVIWMAGGEGNLKGDYFQPNIPSEEVFTTPMKGQAEGIVYSAKPLVYNGTVINDFYFVFKNGKAVEAHARTGEDALKSILTLDEGASYLGECALVPFDSPINNTGLLFYNTLFDENAACHLAIGRGFAELYPDYGKYSDEELLARGINKSFSHVDFMIGSKDLNIVGINDKGEEIQIFENGNWAKEILAKIG